MKIRGMQNEVPRARKCYGFSLSMDLKKHSEFVLVWFRGNSSTNVVLSGTKFIGKQDGRSNCHLAHIVRTASKDARKS
jgi:hypothetical protein